MPGAGGGGAGAGEVQGSAGEVQLQAQVNPDSAPWLENKCLLQVVGGDVRGQEDSVVGVEQE